MCQEHYEGECSQHCPIRPYADSATSSGSLKAMASLPEGMEVRDSSIQGAGLGVFATQEFLTGATFGPYGGEKVRADVPKGGLDTSYMWEVSDVCINLLTISRCVMVFCIPSSNLDDISVYLGLLGFYLRKCVNKIW